MPKPRKAPPQAAAAAAAAPAAAPGGEVTPELVARLEALAAEARARLPFLKALPDAVR